ncbi:40S ribosomal protein S4, partial [Capsicum baccatum]
ARGLKKHLKRLNAPKHWMLDKLGGAFAPKPSSGPHKSRECLPLIIILRNRLKYALTYREVISILMQRQVLVDGKVRTDKTYPAGFMDVVSIPKTNGSFRFLYDTKGRFRLHSLRDEEAKFKLCKVRSVQFGQKGIPYLNTYDGRTIRYPDPLIKANDTIKLDLESSKIVDFIKFDVGNVVMNREKHKGSFETVHIQDAQGHEFATRLGNVFTLGKGTKPWVSLPKGKGIKLSIIEEARKRLAAQSATTARGLKKHLKRLNAPKHWMLDKLGGAFAPKPSSGPHKSRECLPLIIILRNRLKYALTYREVISILMQRQVLVDGKVRTDKTYPAGFMDVVSIPKTNESFRLLYDTKGRFRLHSLRDEEAKFKLCKVRSVQFGQKGIPYLNTYDGRTIRYPDPLIKANDTIKLDLESNKIVDFIKFDVGNVVMVTGGRNRGRVGVIKNREKHKGSFETVHIQDAQGHEFATRLGNVFTLGKGTKPWVSLPKGKGIKLSIIEEARKRLAAQSATTA